MPQHYDAVANGFIEHVCPKFGVLLIASRVMSIDIEIATILSSFSIVGDRYWPLDHSIFRGTFLTSF